jgi:GNAT superfamily N-acetyltransferase
MTAQNEDSSGNVYRTRWATMDDLPHLKAIMAVAIDALQTGLLTPEQIAASHAIMGLDTQLVADGTYLVAESRGVIAGCGGWSRRATLYGGDHSEGLRDPKLLNPAHDPAKIRAMYTRPDFARQGVGRLILSECERAAARAGFLTVELMATLSGERLYSACGYEPVQEVEAVANGIVIPLVKMRKRL